MRLVNYKNPLTWFAVGFGSGLSPCAPGTFGTLMAGLLFYFLIVPFLEPFAFIYTVIFYLFLLISGFFFGLFIYEKTMGEEKDARIFVWDEFVGMWIACFPLIISQSPWPWIVLSFVLFRVFDIWKPFPISYFDRLESSYGVMMDDVLAGLISAFALSAIILS